MNSKRKLTTIIEQSVWKQSEGGPSKSLQMYTSSKEIEIFTSTENKLKKTHSTVVKEIRKGH